MDARRLSLVVLAAQSAAFWPVWSWYARRTVDPSDEPWGLLALATAILLSVRSPRPDRLGGGLRAGSLDASIALTLAYAVLYPFAPPLGRTLVALAALGATLAAFAGDRGFHPARLTLFALATPVLPTLQFVAGYPLRVASGELAALLLRAGGLPVVSRGALLSLGDALVYVDAPCSGVRMLWAGLFLAAVLSWRLRPWPALACLALASVTVILANALRAAALFYPEAGLVSLPHVAHQAIGLAAFALVAIAVAVAARRLEVRPCAA
jgi:exosortase/archaeosortase family protein